MGFSVLCDRFERVLATLLKGCRGLLGGMCPRGVRFHSSWHSGVCGESDHGRILVGDPLQRLTDTLTKFPSRRERVGGVASSWLLGLLQAAKSRRDRVGEESGEGSGEGDIGG